MCICYVSVFDSLPFTNVSVPVTKPWCFHYYSFVQLEFRNGEMSNSFLLSKIVLVILAFLFFYMKLRMIFQDL